MAEEALDAGGQIGEPVGPFRVLDTATRRRAGLVYLIVAVLAAGLILATGVDGMWLTAVFPIVLLAVFQIAGGWKLRVTDMEAIDIASRNASFEVGHGSGTLGFRGWLAKPVWQVLVFAAGPSPDHQALITIDGLTGEVLGSYEEEVPAP
ncbi:MAG: hypothetical protein M5U23_07585 [Acidimicrobiia bacterium]|nr:hypothetical protein [Acidimicrobiia bacterium]